jgi:hypothetical protein
LDVSHLMAMKHKKLSGIRTPQSRHAVDYELTSAISHPTSQISPNTKHQHTERTSFNHHYLISTSITLHAYRPTHSRQTNVTLHRIDMFNQGPWHAITCRTSLAGIFLRITRVRTVPSIHGIIEVISKEFSGLPPMNWTACAGICDGGAR